MRTLKTGGYLLVDEIENHLNRQLVNVVVGLFAARATNPRRATLVFTAHYPQLLDHIHRKGNVYFLVRGADGRTEGGTDGGAQAVKYSDRVQRIENKKSEVFSSNYVKGTAPRYTDVRTLNEQDERAPGAHPLRARSPLTGGCRLPPATNPQRGKALGTPIFSPAYARAPPEYRLKSPLARAQGARRTLRLYRGGSWPAHWTGSPAGLTPA